MSSFVRLCRQRALHTVGATLFLTTTVAGTAVASVSETTTRGPVEATVSLSSEAITLGESLELTLEVRAESGVELLLPEFGQSLERHTLLDFIPTERLDESGRLIREQRYLIRPERSGRHSIPPFMIEFVDRRLTLSHLPGTT